MNIDRESTLSDAKQRPQELRNNPSGVGWCHHHTCPGSNRYSACSLAPLIRLSRVARGKQKQQTYCLMHLATISCLQRTAKKQAGMPKSMELYFFQYWCVCVCFPKKVYLSRFLILFSRFIPNLDPNLQYIQPHTYLTIYTPGHQTISLFQLPRHPPTQSLVRLSKLTRYPIRFYPIIYTPIYVPICIPTPHPSMYRSICPPHTHLCTDLYAHPTPVYVPIYIICPPHTYLRTDPYTHPTPIYVPIHIPPHTHASLLPRALR